MAKIFFDNAATTKLRKEAYEEMLTFLADDYANPSSIYESARVAKVVIETARKEIASALNSREDEIYFTSGATEADNWAIKGVAEMLEKKGNHIITTTVEHHAVLHPCEYLEKKGFEVTYLPVDKLGLISLEDLKNAIKPTTILITIMFANNEIGTIQPVKEIGEIARENKILFHTDAAQALGHIPIDVVDMKIDLLSITAHKIHGPKGIGALYIRKGIRLKPMFHGGTQEKNKRAGTENVPAIVGFGKAVEMAISEMERENERIKPIRERLISGVLEKIPYTIVNGDLERRLPHNVNFTFEFIEGESMLLLLDMNGIYASSGSACTSGSLDPSHVLLALGMPHELAHGSLRISLSHENTMEEIEKFIEVFPPIVARLRAMSPLYDKFLKTGERLTN